LHNAIRSSPVASKAKSTPKVEEQTQLQKKKRLTVDGRVEAKHRELLEGG
jgi:hypothetical protein